MPNLAGIVDLRDNAGLEFEMAQNLGYTIGQAFFGWQNQNKLQARKQEDDFAQQEIIRIVSNPDFDPQTALQEMSQVRGAARNRLYQQFTQDYVSNLSRPEQTTNLQPFTGSDGRNYLLNPKTGETSQLPIEPKQEKPSFQEQIYGQMTPEQQAAFINKEAGIKPEAPPSKSEVEGGLLQKIAQGTATDQEIKAFELVNGPLSQTTVNNILGDGTTGTLNEQLGLLKQGQQLIEEFRNNPANSEVLKNSDVNVVTNSKGELQLEVKPKSAASAQQQKEISDLFSLRNSVDTARALYDPSYVGIVEGNQLVNTIQEKTGTGATTQKSQFRRVILDIADRLLRARSGAQINEQEYARLLKILPEPTLKEVAFKARLDSFEKELDDIIRLKQKTIEQSGARPINLDDIEQTANKYLGL